MADEKESILAGVVHKNIDTLLRIRTERENQKNAGEHIADAITRFAGSLWSVIFHGGFILAWILVNRGVDAKEMPEIEELKRDTPPELVLRHLENAERKLGA